MSNWPKWPLSKYIIMMPLVRYLITACMSLTFSFSLAQPANRVKSLLDKMSLEEKVGQMAQVTLDVLGKMQKGSFQLNDSLVSDAIVKYGLGSVLNTSENRAMTRQEWNRIIGQLQQAALKTNTKIPLIYGIDAMHGSTYISAATFFPQQLGLAATWNRKMAFDAASVTAYETRAASIPWNFAPVLDLGVNPLWARLWETFGEDPYLVSELGVQSINGYQYPQNNTFKIAACLKHFLGYSDPRSGKDRTNAWIPEHYLREYHLPAFRAAVRAGAKSVMVNSALINGIPTHMNRALLTGMLKEELGFTGIVVTDWQDIENIYKRDKITGSHKEALMLAINAGVDMAMIPYDYTSFCNDLVALVKEKKVSMARINDAVQRILQVKSELGLFEQPVSVAAAYPDFGQKSFEKMAFDAAAESITLLKNQQNILPISSNSKVLVTGPNAHSMRTLNGGWSYSWQGEKTAEFTSQYHTILSALKKKWKPENVLFAEGVAYKMQGKYFEDSVVSISAVIQAADSVDYIILCLGENSYTEKPGDLNDLTLSDNQLMLAQAVLQTKKPVILILNEGRPRIISKIEPMAAAVLMAYLPGNFGGEAIAGILSGEINPSGKLPITYPRYVNALTNYIHKPSDEQSNPQGAYDYSADYNPQYDFGFGLSYTKFTYSNLSVNKSVAEAGDSIKVSVLIKNTGERDGKEIIQVYVSDPVASLSPDVKRLRAFDKIDLKSGQEKQVVFTIAMNDLAYVQPDQSWILEKGELIIQVGSLKQKIMVSKSATWR